MPLIRTTAAEPQRGTEPMTTRTATARYTGMGKPGKGQLTSPSGVLDATPYGFNTRFGDEKGTNPEELIAAAHAGCFTMALSFALAQAGFDDGTLETTAAVTLETDGDGFTITRSALTLRAEVPGISQDQFGALAEGAEQNCPVSKLLKAEITLDWQLA
jgi:lipoyl-dependent peroxiredoxin